MRAANSHLASATLLTELQVYMGCDGSLYAFSLFLPTIVKEMGYKSTHAQLLSVPPYAVAAVMTVTIGFIADKTLMRGTYHHPLSQMRLTFIRLLQHGNGSSRRHRLQHAPWIWQSSHPVWWHVPRRPRHLSLHRQHNHMDGQ